MCLCFPLPEDHGAGVLVSLYQVLLYIVAFLELVLLEEIEHAAAAVARPFVRVLCYRGHRLLRRKSGQAGLGLGARKVLQCGGVDAA